MSRKRSTCKCIDSMNAHLAATGYRLDLAFTMGGEVFPRLCVERDPDATTKRRMRAPVVAATHCPFCGTAYRKGVPR